ncbi:MAG TPA: hypothetical protein VHV57_15665 [Acidimicrobiales bacterium]|jgi:uncharacterized protein YbjT (DUF2867 family)|nr:hypothetical protein [Acidimicrobiales bacterium]
MRIAVAGGSGTVGRYAVLAAREAGHEVVPMSRTGGVDVRTGAGLADALSGVDVIIDAANAPSLNRAKATAFFTEVAGRLHEVGSAQGVSRIVIMSIVGLERVPGYGYYEAKLAQEAAALAGPLPVSILRATQFHEFPGQILSRMSLGPLALMPIMKVQSIAAREAGRALLEVAVNPPPGTTSEIAGPGPSDLVTLARAMVKARGTRTVVLPVPVPGPGGKAMRAEALLPTTGVRLAGPTFAEWLAGPDAAPLLH